MAVFRLLASVYESWEEVERHHQANLALNYMYASKCMPIQADSPREAINLFMDSDRCRSIFPRRKDNAVSIYCFDEYGREVSELYFSK